MCAVFYFVFAIVIEASKLMLCCLPSYIIKFKNKCFPARNSEWNLIKWNQFAKTQAPGKSLPTSSALSIASCFLAKS